MCKAYDIDMPVICKGIESGIRAVRLVEGAEGGCLPPHGPGGPFPPRIFLNRKCIPGDHSRLAPIMATVARNPTAQISERQGTRPKA